MKAIYVREQGPTVRQRGRSALARSEGRLIDLTFGQRGRTSAFLDTGHVVLLPSGLEETARRLSDARKGFG